MRIQDEKDPKLDYQIRDLPPSQTRHNWIDYFEVSKWDGSRVPVNVYSITHNRENGRYTCDCPAAFRGQCKHIKMVQNFEQAGKPATFPTLEKLEAL